MSTPRKVSRAAPLRARSVKARLTNSLECLAEWALNRKRTERKLSRTMTERHGMLRDGLQKYYAMQERERELRAEIEALETIIEQRVGLPRGTLRNMDAAPTALAASDAGAGHHARRGVSFAPRPALDGGHLDITPVRDYKFSSKTCFASRGGSSSEQLE